METINHRSGNNLSVQSSSFGKQLQGLEGLTGPIKINVGSNHEKMDTPCVERIVHAGT